MTISSCVTVRQQYVPFSLCGICLIELIATLVATCMRSNVVSNSAIIDHFRRSASLHLIRVQEVQPGELVGNIVNAYGIRYPTPTNVPRSSDICWQFAHLRRFTVASAMSWDGEVPIKRRSLPRRLEPLHAGIQETWKRLLWLDSYVPSIGCADSKD